MTNGFRESTGEARKGHWTFQRGKIGWILLWLLGVPIPILLVLYFLRGCT
jgi:hypothetical protein